MKKIYEGILKEGNQIFTLNLVEGIRVYNEKILKKSGKEYRSWNPYRSKMAGAILKGAEAPIKKDSRILYLGVANGTTASHFSDIALNGMIYGVEISFRAMKDFIKLCKKRYNLIPIIADANKPEMYEAIVENVDLIYQDISQRNQVQIFLKNMEKFEPKNGIAMIKARSIDVAKKPNEVFKEVEKKIEERYKIRKAIKLSPYAKDHIAIFV